MYRGNGVSLLEDVQLSPEATPTPSLPVWG